MRWHPRDWPIAGRITGAMIVLTVAAVATVQTAGLVRGQEKFRRISLATLKVVARTTAERLGQLVRKARVDARALALSGPVVDLCSGRPGLRAQYQLETLCDNDSDLLLLRVVGATGDILASAPRTETTERNVRHRPYFAPVRTGEPYLSSMRVGEGGLGVYLSEPVVGAAGRVIGVVVIKLDGERIRNTIADISLDGTRLAMLAEKIGDDHYVLLAFHDRAFEYTSGRPLTEEQQLEAMERWGRRVEYKPILTEQLDDSGFRATRDGVVWIGAGAELERLPWLVMALLPRAVFESDFWALLRSQLVTVLIVLAFAGILAYAQSRSILRPVRALTDAAERVAAGDLEARAEITTEDELGRLSRVFDRMVPQLAENLQLKQSLAIAGDVQRELLPSERPEFPGLDVCGATEPYEQIGGDYFDYLDLRPFGDTRLAVVVGDVVGHGIAAAMLMATARAHVRSRAQPLPALDQLFDEVNLRLGADLGEDQFMTLALYAFDPARGRLDWCSAGQDPAFHYRAVTGEIEEVVLKNVPIGVLPDWEYHAGSREDLAPGDVLLIGTDGIWETRNAAREEFDKERLRDLLKKNHDQGAAEILESVLGAVRRFRGDLPRQDDVTLVVIRVL